MAEIFTCTINNSLRSEVRDLLAKYQLPAKETEGSLSSDFEIRVVTREDAQKVANLSIEFNRMVRDRALLEYAEELRAEKLRKVNFWRILTFRRKLKSI
jgi:hypothetical protein